MAGPPDSQNDEAQEHGRQLSEALRSARELLGMQVAWVAEFREGLKVFQDVEGDADSFGIAQGASVPLDGTYCVRVARGDIPNVIPDVRAEPLVADLPATRRHDLGAYVGIPIELDDGTVYGTLCFASHRANPAVREADLGFLRSIARRAARDIEDRRLRVRRAAT